VTWVSLIYLPLVLLVMVLDQGLVLGSSSPHSVSV